MPSIFLQLKKTSLQGKHTCTHVKSNNSCRQKNKGNYKNVMEKGACCFPSGTGSMSLEASLVLPLFLFVMTGCMLFGEMLMIKGRMQHGLVEAAKELAVMEYYQNKKGGHGNVLLARTFQKRYAQEKAHAKVIQVSGVSFLGSKITNERGEVELHMNYRISLNYPFIGKKTMRVTEVAIQKAFTGYQPTEFESGKGYAYVTKYGNVYHTSMQCSHIMLQISDAGEVERYLQGKSRYRPCEKCVKDRKEGIHQLFVAKEGDCYHTSLDCSGLTRSVRKVTIWETEGMQVCERCGR
jgi:hypothetical protein